MSIPLMLATLTDRRDFGEEWLLERKLDGERCVARKDRADVRLQSRSGKDLTGTYPRCGPPSRRRPGGWTRDGRLRQARFLGLRDDKCADEVVRERAW